jgi:hypothetical protein
MRPFALLLALATAAGAQDFSVADVLGDAAMRARQAPSVNGVCVGCSGHDGPAERFAATLSGGFWGGGKAAPLPRADGRVLPINLGFTALGLKGAEGRISGPGLQGLGDGHYRVVENSPFLVVVRLDTGFVSGRLVLSRDPGTGADTIGFLGRVMEGGAWGAMRSELNPGAVDYDASEDRGSVRWSAGGKPSRDSYERGGEPGSRAMRLTLNGHPHDFFRER